MTKYLLDSDVFIQAKNMHYGMDFCPAFWHWLDRRNRDGRVFSIAAVLDELTDAQDDVSHWAKARDGTFFLPANNEMADKLPDVSVWVNGQKTFRPAAISEFLAAADYFLIAYALGNGFTIVSQEKYSDGHKRIKIPNACRGLNIPCINTFEFLRIEKARFQISSSSTCDCNCHVEELSVEEEGPKEELQQDE